MSKLANSEFRVWLRPGILAIFGAALDTAVHSHRAIQIVIPKVNSYCQLNKRQMDKAFVLSSAFNHQLTMACGWILLVEPETDFSQKLQELLVKETLLELSGLEAIRLTMIMPDQSPAELLTAIFKALGFEHLFENLGVPSQRESLSTTIQDPRIQQLLSNFDQCLKDECQLLNDWHASVVASDLALSESRFLHLFREEMGIAWRPYLLWRRMICAVDAMISGASATDAAHLAGFSDSAHLSRTFRKQFGVTIRQAKRLFSNA